VGGGGKLYRDTSKRLSPTTAGNIIDDSSKTSSSLEQQITVSIDDDPLHHLTAAILHSSSKRQLTVITNDDLPHHLTATIHLLPVQQISADVNEDLQRSLLHPDSLFTAGTADLQKRQRSSTVFATTIYRTNKKIGLRRLKNVIADGRYKYGLNVKSFTAVQKIRGNV